jgi:hypothetical protein
MWLLDLLAMGLIITVLSRAVGAVFFPRRHKPR